jgi:hypothetical protein
LSTDTKFSSFTKPRTPMKRTPWTPNANPLKRTPMKRTRMKQGTGKKAQWNPFIAAVNLELFRLLDIDYCEIRFEGCENRRDLLTTAHTRRRQDIPLFDYYYAFRSVRGCSEPCHKQADANRRNAEVTLERILVARNERLGLSESDWVTLVLLAVAHVHRARPEFKKFNPTAGDLTPTSFERKRKI